MTHQPIDPPVAFQILTDLVELLERNLDNVAAVVDRHGEGEKMIRHGMPTAGQIWIESADRMANIVADQQARIAQAALKYAEYVPEPQTIATEQWGVISIARLKLCLYAWMEPDVDTIRQAFAHKRDNPL